MNYLTEEEFKEFKDNDFNHLREQIEVLANRTRKIENKLSTMEGKVSILIPLTLTILSGIVGLIILAVI